MMNSEENHPSVAALRTLGMHGRDAERVVTLYLLEMLARELRRLYPNDWNVEKYDNLLGHKATWEKIKAGAAWAEIEQGWQSELEKFRERRKAFLLYPQ